MSGCHGGSVRFGNTGSFWGCTLFLAAIILAPLSGYAADTDYKIDSTLLKALAEDADATAPFFVVFSDRADLKPAVRIADRAERGRFVVSELQDVADRSQAGVRGYLSAQNVDFTPFWVENKIYISAGTLDLARDLARRPEVAAILPEQVYVIEPDVTTSSTSTPQWNITKIKADQVAASGTGMVVANIDTGVQYDHPALVNQYRGNNGGSFNHTGNWKDATGLCGAVPCDNNSHGTHTMGTMVGDDGVTRIGVAPGAKWIACKACASSSCDGSALAVCAQWVLDPLGNNTGSNQPDVVNNSWSGGGGNTWFQSYLQNWRAAGVFPAFSAGNSGPNCSTTGSPGDYPDSLASGGVDSNDVVASWSARGPSLLGGIKPDLAAPGVNILSSLPGSLYGLKSGTSMASPHTAGAVALLWSAATAYRGNIAGTENLLTGGAARIGTTETCGGLAAGAIPNNTYGYGRLDVLAAVNLAGGTPTNQAPTVSITAPANGASYTCPATVAFSGSASDPEQGSLSGSIAWTDSGLGSLGTGASIAKAYDCTTVGNHTVTAKVTDNKGLSDTDSITISIVAPVLAAPSNLTATVSSGVVTLAWVDNSSTEDGFLVERKSGGSWTKLPVTGPNVITYQDSPGRGSYQYRVSTFKGLVSSAVSNIVSVKLR